MVAIEAKRDMATPGVPAKQEHGVYRWYVVGLLFIAYVLSAVDAGVIKLLAEPIKNDLGLGDTELGLLQGFAFAITYAIAAIPLGLVVDRTRHRNWVITGGILFWSVMTLMCGLATRFGQLFFARVGVGIGEAALSPTAYSLIGDYFNAQKRPFANAFYAIGYSVGAALAVIVGGSLLAHFSAAPIVSFPILGDLKPWQAVFVVVSLPGVVVALLMLTIREPDRREVAQSATARSVTTADAVRHVLDNFRLYLMLIGTISLVGALAIGSSAWYPSLLMRVYGMSITQVTTLYGIPLLVCGVVGTLSGGWLSSRLIGSGRRDANMMVALGTILIKAVPLLLAPLMPTGEWAIAMIALSTLIGQGAQGVMIAAIQEVTPSQLRGQVIAFTLLFVNLVGTGGGALLFGALSEHMFTGQDSLRWALFAGGVILLPMIVINLLSGMKYYRAALMKAGS